MNTWNSPTPQPPRPAAPPAGWYPDPAGGGAFRYWDGGRWTDAIAAQPSPLPTSTGTQSHFFAAGSGPAIVTPLGTTNPARIVVIALLVIAVIVVLGLLSA